MNSNEPGLGSTFFIELPLVASRVVENEHIHLKTPQSESLVSSIQEAMPAVKPRNEMRFIPAKEGRIEEVLIQPTFIHQNIKPNVDIWKRRRVLLVDDAALNRKMMSRLLATRHFDIREASDGLEALYHLRASLQDRLPPYDVILMDFVMPNMDGPTATREIRALGYQGIIIGVTGNALAEDIELFITCGANKVLPKPLQIEDLIDTLTGMH